MSAPSRRTHRQRPGPLLRGLLVGTLAAGLLLAGALGGALPAIAQAPAATPSPAPSASSTTRALPVEVSVTAVTPEMVRPDGQLLVRATFVNRGDQEIADPRANLRIRRFLISTRSALQQWTAFGPTDTAGTVVQSVTLGAPLAPGARAEVELLVAASDLGLSAAPAAWGPRGISVEATDGRTRVGLARTFVVWLPAEPERSLRVSVAVPFTGEPVDAAAAVEPTVPPAKTVDRLTDVLAVTRDTPAVAWAVDPALLSALAAGTVAPPGATDLTPSGGDTPSDPTNAAVLAAGLAQAASGRDVFTLPAFDPDLAALAHAGATDLATGATALAAAAPLPVLNTPPRTDLAWPADDVPDLQTVTLAAQSGARAVMVGGDGLVAQDLNYTPTGRATVPTATGDVTALVADRTLTDLFTDPAAAMSPDAENGSDQGAVTPSEPVTAATAAQRVLAETAIIARERPNDPRHVLIAPHRGWAPDVGVAHAQLAVLADAPWITLTPLSGLLGTADPGVERISLPERSKSGRELAPSSIDSMRAARDTLTTFSTIVPNPAALTAGADAAVLAPLSVAWRADANGRAAVVQEVVGDLTARASGVSVMTGSGLNLISQAGTLPIGLRNVLDQDVTVQISLVPASRVLVVDGPQTVVVPAQSDLQARIPFRAVGSGDVRVEVTLLTPSGTAISAPTSFVVRVRADWENIGTAIVAGLLGLGFLFGITRTIRRGHAKTRGASAAELAAITELTGPPKDTR
ncbi:MAG: DUF6049 family protein [Cellulomonas sp.]